MKMNYIHNKDLYSWIALVLVIAGDCFAVLGRRDWNYWRYWVLADILLLLILGLIGWMNNTKFKFRTLILTKLLANATGLKLLNVLYLIFFAINFAGIGNAILPLFQPNIDLGEAFYPLLVCGVVLLGLILFFPDVHKDKNDDAEYVCIAVTTTNNSTTYTWELLGRSGSWALDNHVHGNITNTGLLSTENRMVITDANKAITTSGHYASATSLAINSTSAPDENLYVNGTYIQVGGNKSAEGNRKPRSS